MKPINTSIVVAANVLGIGRSKTYELINAGLLDTVKIGRRTLVRVSSIEAFSDSLAKPGA
ncbi:helix-turn-helix domain-containing protein [Sandarakinorhabdus sp.]|uniref:helix-turn-helix domain-containing protein n=1 Tax=Sandarakinorhabdus sp. TaxID=1916663 RepID=UPI00286E64AB|nr:helix-turn-helix domain-containing protein [Sandarakinorhabdus sp.]